MARKREHGAVMGLDLSLRQSAGVVVPFGWVEKRARWRSLKTVVAGVGLEGDATESARVARIIAIARSLVHYARENGVTHVFVEQYAFSRGQSHAHALGELGGVVKALFWEQLGIVPQPVVASQARKLLLGIVPRKGGKAYAQARLREMGARFATEDEGDAFVVANYGLSELGRSCLCSNG